MMNNDQPGHFVIKMFEYYSKAFQQIIRLNMFYLNIGDEKGFSHVNELIIQHKLEITISKLKKQSLKVAAHWIGMELSDRIETESNCLSTIF